MIFDREDGVWNRVLAAFPFRILDKRVLAFVDQYTLDATEDRILRRDSDACELGRAIKWKPAAILIGNAANIATDGYIG